MTMSAKINWIEEVQNRKDQIIQDTQQFLKIKSVLDEENATDEAPFGQGINEALQFLLQKGENDGFIVKNLNGLAAHIEYGEGAKLIGVLCHIDVVPEGDGWTSDPFAADIRDGKIYARGAMDDKGPTIAAYYALKIVKELRLPLSKRVRIILGTDEESDWRCVDHYFKHEEMPTLGFAPDADFPIINAEKGIFDFTLEQKRQAHDPYQGIILDFFRAGRRLNMVPDFAEAIVICHDTQIAVALKNLFEDFVQEQHVNGIAAIDDLSVHFKLEGVSAHGMEPSKGKNAGLLLNQFLHTTELDPNGSRFVSFTHHYFGQDTRGKALGIAFEDDISGELTINMGTIVYKKDQGGKLGLNLRYPVTHHIDDSKDKIAAIAISNDFSFKELDDSKPHYVDEQHMLIKVLKKVYEEQTGEDAKLIAIGGGTYARSLDAGVAFGPLFPGQPDVAHQKDEYIEIDNLLKATAIYAQAIYELAKD